MPRPREEEAEDDDDYQEEEFSDDDRAKRPKKKKRKFTGFLDVEAEEDDNEDDDEGDEAIAGLIADDDGDAEAEDDRQRARAQQFQRRQAFAADDPKEYMDYINKKFGENESDDDDVDQRPPDTSGIDQQSLLPTIRDPRLYIVKCRKPGHERRAILTLLQKFFDLKKKGRDLGIVSAVAPEHLKGRIYIEASSSAQVEFAVSGLDLFATYDGVKALRLEEMTDVLKVGKRLDKQAPGNWVRRTRGIYKGDLAQVVRVGDGNENYCTIRLIPRLDIKGEREYMENADDDYEDDENGNTPGLVLNTKRRGRPPQHLFDKREIYRLTGSADVYTQRDTHTGEIFDYWNNDTYRHGLLYARVSTKALIVGENVQPQVEELEKWMAAEQRMRLAYEEDPSIMTTEEARLGLNLKFSATTGNRKTGLFKGDSVHITKGEQKGLRGTIAGFDGDSVLMQTVEFPEPLRVSRADVVKTFKIADHVNVAAGKHAGQAGVIVNVDGEFLTIFTDSTREDIRVLSSHVADSADLNVNITVGRHGAAQSRVHYELFDLVQLQSDPNNKGVVVRVKSDGVEILNSQNIRQIVPFSEIKCKVQDRSARAMDARQNPIAPNDTIHVISGPAKDSHGVVQHVAGATVFFKARDEIKNCGIVAVPANLCTAHTAAARRLSSSMAGSQSMYKAPAPIPRGSIASLGMGGALSRSQGGRGGMGGGPRSRDPLMRKDVKIIQGQWKGYRGKVVYCDDNVVRVELASKMKTITIAKGKVRDVDSNGPTANGPGAPTGARPLSGLNGRFGAPRPLAGPIGMRTPRAENYMQTPKQVTGRYGSAGSRTPAPNYGGSTPFRSFGGMTPRAGQTPRTNYARAGTPGRGDAFRPATPGLARDYDIETPYSRTANTPLPMTPADAGIANPYAPYAQPAAVPQTPATPGDGLAVSTPGPSSYGIVEPRTPANIMEPRTPAPIGNEPRTPAPGLEPATPAPMMEPHTPAPGMEPATPMMHSMEPATPMMHEPATPHTPAMIPQTPHPQEDEPVGYKVLIDVMVSVVPENNQTGVVVDAAVDGSFVVVKMVNGDKKGSTLRLEGRSITPVQPRSDIDDQNYEMVKVLDGSYQGRMGRLTAVNHQDETNPEGVVSFDGGEVGVLPLSLVAKCHDPSEED